MKVYFSWSVYRNNPSQNSDVNGYCGATFSSRKLCIEWLKFKKEQHFFETGSMEEAERIWGIDNFRFEQEAVIQRQELFKNFNPKMEDWDYQS